MLNKILITGANGQLGRELRTLSAKYPAWEFIFTDLPELDITSAEQVRKIVSGIKPIFIINCAAYTAVDKAESEPHQARLINADAVKNLVDAAMQAGAYFIHISTDYVFDGKNYLPYRETDLPNPQSVYGATKLQGEQFALAYHRSAVIRTAWLYSAYGNNFVKTMLRLGREKSSIDVIADQIGSPTCAYDLAAAILQIVDAASRDAGNFACGVFHFTNEGVCSWYDFASAIMQFAGLPCAVNPIDAKDYPSAAQRPPYSILHKGRIKQLYGIEIRHWQEALRECLINLP